MLLIYSGSCLRLYVKHGHEEISHSSGRFSLNRTRCDWDRHQSCDWNNGDRFHLFTLQILLNTLRQLGRFQILSPSFVSTRDTKVAATFCSANRILDATAPSCAQVSWFWFYQHIDTNSNLDWYSRTQVAQISRAEDGIFSKLHEWAKVLPKRFCMSRGEDCKSNKNVKLYSSGNFVKSSALGLYFGRGSLGEGLIHF